MGYIRKDSYYKKAKKEGYNSRAVYKLVEIDNKYKLFENVHYILDIGAAPGSWSQVVLEKIQPGSQVVAIDIIDVKNITKKNFTFIKGDIFDDSVITKLLHICSVFDVIVSDAAPNTTGDKTVDHYNSVEIVKRIIHIATLFLKSGGNLLFKLFEGVETKAIVESLKESYKEVKIYRPQATRVGSYEQYIICKFKN
jgi:23S rRNA (uridine2552-2'-O)-methyltransferase